MRIDGVGPESARPSDARSVEKASDKDAKAKKSKSGAPQTGADRIEISEAGRAAAARLAGAGAVDGESLSVERVEQVRARIDDGTYDTPEVQEEVARRLLDSGDLTGPEGAGA